MAKPVEQNVEFESVSIHPDNFVEGYVDNIDAAIVDAYYIPFKYERGKFWSLFAKIFFRATSEYGNKEFSEIYEVGRLDNLYPAEKKKGKLVLSGGATVEQWKALANPDIGGKVDDPDAFKGHYIAISPGSRSQPAQRNFYNFQTMLKKIHPDPDHPGDENYTSFQFSDDIHCIVNENKIYHLSRISFDKRKEEDLKPGEKLFKILVPVSVVSVDGDESEEEKPKKKGAVKGTAKKVKEEDDEEIELDELDEELEEEEEEEGDEDEEGDEEEEEDEEENEVDEDIDEDEDDEDSDNDDAESIARTQVLKVLKSGPTTHATLTPKVMAAVADMPPKNRKAVLELLNSPKWMTKNKSWNFNADTKKYSAKK